MNNITKVSEITYEDIVNYIRINEISNEDINTLNTLICVAKAYIQGYTGQPYDNLDNFQDFVIVVFVLCQDMWDNRTLYVDNSNLNKVVQGILDLHSINLL